MVHGLVERGQGTSRSRLQALEISVNSKNPAGSSYVTLEPVGRSYRKEVDVSSIKKLSYGKSSPETEWDSSEPPMAGGVQG